MSGSCAVHLYNAKCGVLWKCRIFRSTVQKCAESPVDGGSWLQGGLGLDGSVCWPVLAGEDGGGRLGSVLTGGQRDTSH